MSDPTLSEMLAMAAISYRGFNLIGPTSYKLMRLHQTLDESFDRFPSVRGKWKITWGPAACSLSLFGLDDVVVYVAEAIGEPSKLTIVIRGTNPISLADWIFGALMFEEMAVWPYGGTSKPADARISGSVALGLGILRRLGFANSETAGRGRSEDSAVTATIDEWRERIARIIGPSLRQEIKEVIPRLADPNFNPITELDLKPTIGQTLKAFLKQRVSEAPKSEIYVTGHSKGGALSSTVALWLTDTQGPTIAPEESWDPENRAAIRCYSFAGPTAGNAPFADYSDARLGASCRRVWNRMDIVPRGFVASELRRISSDYGLTGLAAAAVNELVERVADQAEKFNYKQICGTGMMLDCPLEANLSFPLQIVHQHMDSYLKKVGLFSEMNVATLFAPVL